MDLQKILPEHPLRRASYTTRTEMRHTPIVGMARSSAGPFCTVPAARQCTPGCLPRQECLPVWPMESLLCSPLSARDCWFLTGPTASGKSAVGMELARRIGAEIVSLDSIALYRGMDIGTAKPTARGSPRGAAPPDRRARSARGIQPGPVHRGRRASCGGNRRPRTASALRRRNAALLEGTAAGSLPGAAGRLGAAPPAGRRRPAARRRLAPRASGRGRSRRRRPAASERHPPAHPGDRGFREDWAGRSASCSGSSRSARPAEECRVFVLDWPRDGTVRSNRPPGGADVLSRTGRGGPAALGRRRVR